MYKLAIYGKGGIGKSTTACNVAAALAAAGHTVMQIGCDPKADSTRLHMGGRSLPTVLDRLREADAGSSGNAVRALGGFGGIDVALDDIAFRAPNGVICVEAGGPVPGQGCAGRGIIAAFDLLEKLSAYRVFDPDFVIYDVLGDVVCGGFAMPLRNRYADEVAVVTSGEMMALYAASNILQAVHGFQRRGYARPLGLIANLRNVEDEEAKIARFCDEEGTRVIATIERSPLFQDAEDAGAPLFDLFPDSEAAAAYRALAAFFEERAQMMGVSPDSGIVSIAVGKKEPGGQIPGAFSCEVG